MARGETGFAGGFVVGPSVIYADWAGTAEAPKATVIDSAGTGTEPLLNGAASVGNGNPRTNFIQGLATLRGQGFDFAGTAFADATIFGDVLLLGENSPSGVAFSYVDRENKYYAGLLPTTNLGAPITDPNTDAIWNAKFEAISAPVGSSSLESYSNPGFKMQVIFDGSEGTINSGTESSGGVFTAGQISASYTDHTGVSDSINFNIQGKFGSNGLLYGIVNAPHPIAGLQSLPLTGLIGYGGAVGAFMGFQHVGGFVASPTLVITSNVTIANWLDSFNPSLSAQPETASPANQFLVGSFTEGVYTNSDGTGDVTAEALNLRTATFNENSLGGSANNRILFFTGYNGSTRHYYAGLGSPFGLGATLPVWQTGQPTSAEWKGQFSVLQGATARADADLTLEVNFENRRLTAFVPVGANHYLLDAGFNADDDGFFAGTVNFGAFTDTTNRTSTNTLTPGVLTGIIGAEGAMGVFVSGTSKR